MTRLIAAPIVLGYSDLMAAVWNDVIVGLVVLSFAWYRTARPAQAVWLSWTNALLGAWLIIAPFTLGYSDVMAGVWNDVVVGLIVLSLAIWSAVTGSRMAGGPMGSRSGHDAGTGRAA
jgi:hypothetical protein